MEEYDPESPCISVCKTDENEVCMGCGRNISEIIEWGKASSDRKRQILANCKNRGY